MIKEMEQFLCRFGFKPELRGYLGVERERFLRTLSGLLVPRAMDFLSLLQSPLWSYEFSACQVEDITNPKKDPRVLKRALQYNDRRGEYIARFLGLKFDMNEVAEKNMPMDIYPDKRYLEMAQKLPQEVLLAAFRVIGTHIHIGVGSLGEAIRVHNALRMNLDKLCQLGDHSDGKRLKLYKQVAKHPYPPHYENEEHFFTVAKEQGFLETPRSCYHLIRISIHGTVEVRAFGATSSIAEVLSWAELIKQILSQVE